MHASNRSFSTGIIQIQTQWQRIYEEAYGVADPLAPLHATSQYRTEHYLLHPAAAGQHLSPSQMTQTCHAHSQPPSLDPQTLIQSLGQHATQLGARDAIVVDVA